MTSTDITNILISIISGVLGGVAVAIVNYYLTRKKTDAEIKKIDAETEKIRVETQVALTNIEGLSAAVNYKLAETSEQVIYDSTRRYDPYDFRGVEGRFWDRKENRSIGPKGTGSLLIEQDRDGTGTVLNIQRTNTEGRYEVWFQNFFYNGHTTEFIPMNQQIAGKRKIRVSCEAKAFGGEHSLRFILKNQKTNQWLTNSKVRVIQNEWTPIDLYFQVSPEANILFRIDNEEVSNSPSSVQIRRIILAERTS